MKQLYYTSCRLGQSVNGQSGFQIRSVTPGLENDKRRAAVAYVGYKPPDSLPPTEDAVAAAPVRLALLQTPDLGRLLLHSVYVGREGQGTRFGNFFSHLVLDVPADVAARDAVRLWRSPFWRCQDDDDCAKDLPEASLPAASEPSGGLDVKKLLADERGREMLRFLLDALLLPQHRERRVFLAAPAEEVACCLFAATSVLPRGLIRELTFSTYEYAPLACRARVVGADPSTDLPAGCFSDSCLGFHCSSGRKSDLGGATHFAEKVVPELAQGNLSKMAGFAEWCEKRRVHDGTLLDLALRLVTSKEYIPPEEEVRRALEQGPLGKEMLKRPTVIEQLSSANCGLALQNKELAEALFRHPRALQKIVYWGRNDVAFHEEALRRALDYLDAMEDRLLQDRKDLADDVRDNLRGWLSLQRMVKEPSLAEVDLRSAGTVLSWAPSGARERCLQTLTDSIAEVYASKPGEDPQATLEKIVNLLAPDAAGLVFARLGGYFTSRARNLTRPGVVVALAAVGLGECRTLSLSERLGADSVGVVEDLVRALKKENKAKLLQALRHEARDWHPGPRAHVRRLVPLSWWKRFRRSRLWWPSWILLVMALLASVLFLALRWLL